MEFYYVVEKKVWEGNLHFFRESHYIDLPEEGLILLCATFHHRAHEANWSNMHSVEALPHPLINEPIVDDHADLLSHLGVVKGDGTLQVAKKVEKINSAFRFSGV